VLSLLADIEKASGRLGKKTRKSPVRAPKTLCLFEGCNELRMQPGETDSRKTAYSYCRKHFSIKTRDRATCNAETTEVQK
jgi:hypothetical protein